MRRSALGQKNINRQLIFISALILCITGLIIIVFANSMMHRQALNEAEERSLIILNRNLATHTYFSHQLKPNLFEITDQIKPDSYFEPTWMSSTYAVREIDRYFQQLSDINYYYKECAINARSPQNEADEFERQFIERLNAEPGLNKISGIRKVEDETTFFVLQRGETMEASCLRCHSTPEQAPLEMLSRYGSERSFNRRLGETVSAISIRIPLSDAYKRTNLVSAKLSLILIAVLIISYILHYGAINRVLVEPLKKIKCRAMLIAHDPSTLGEEIELNAAQELTELAEALNSMSRSLKQHKDRLEDMVQERTHELSLANDQLQESLENIRKLSGLLPICSKCKKIRDDKGYWNQLEAYIEGHSEALFSHGLCSECADTLYGDQEWYRKKDDE